MNENNETDIHERLAAIASKHEQPRSVSIEVTSSTKMIVKGRGLCMH